MPRQSRLEIPGVPLHVTQRGVNRCAIFLDDLDRHHFRRLLREKCDAFEVAVHAFALMDNHVHLLLSCTTAGGVSSAMRHLGQSYVRCFNDRHGRSGALWQGRFKSCLVDSERYLLAVIRYIELNPVRAALTEHAECYRWSSAHVHARCAHDPLVTLHPSYLSLGRTAQERAAHYRSMLYAELPDHELQAIRSYIKQERALGGPRFQQLVEKTLNRPVTWRRPGRPAKTPD